MGHPQCGESWGRTADREESTTAQEAPRRSWEKVTPRENTAHGTERDGRGDLGDLVAWEELGKSSCFPTSEPLGEPEKAGLGAAPRL